MKVYKLRHKETGKYLKRAYKGGRWSLTKNGTIFERLPSEKRFLTYSIAKEYPFTAFEIVELNLNSVTHFADDDLEYWVMKSGTGFPDGNQRYHFVWDDAYGSGDSFMFITKDKLDYIIKTLVQHDKAI